MSDTKQEKTGRQQVKRHPDGKFKKGVSGNPDGRPKGSLGFKTKFYKFLDKLAEEKGVDPQDLEEDIYKAYYQKIVHGDAKMLKDVLDRTHGKAPASVDITTKGNPLHYLLLEIQDEKEPLVKSNKDSRRNDDDRGADEESEEQRVEAQ